jgi:hypothetical protein
MPVDAPVMTTDCISNSPFGSQIVPRARSAGRVKQTGGQSKIDARTSGDGLARLVAIRG